jgi:eukaryotic-like serine/threonine-protein kinase
LNSEMLHGGLAIREFAGEPYFVMMDNYPRSTVDAEEIRRSVLEIAHRADAVERMLTEKDVN